MEIIDLLNENFGETAVQVFLYFVIVVAGSSLLVKIGQKIVVFTKTKKDDEIFAKMFNYLEVVRPFFGKVLNVLAINPSASDLEVLNAAVKKLKEKKKK